MATASAFNLRADRVIVIDREQYRLDHVQKHTPAEAINYREVEDLQDCLKELTAYPNAEINQTDPDDPGAALVSVQCIVVDPADRLWIVDTGSPMFEPTQYGGPKLVCVDLGTNEVVKKILFPQDVALPTIYLNDVRFDLRRGTEGIAYVTDSFDKGPNGIIVVDLASGESWRRLHDHPSTKAETPKTVRPVVEGRPLMERSPDGKTKPITMGSDGIAISADGSRIYYCPLMSRKLYSVDTEALADRSRDDAAVAATVVDEGDRGGASDGLESDASGYVYSTNYEHNSVLRRGPGGEWETVVYDPRLLWPDTMSVATDGYLYVTANQLHRQARYHADRICGANRTPSSAFASTRSRSCCGNRHKLLGDPEAVPRPRGRGTVAVRWAMVFRHGAMLAIAPGGTYNVGVPPDRPKID